MGRSGRERRVAGEKPLGRGSAIPSLAAGLSVVVAMPEDTPAPILGNVAAAAHLYPDRVKLELVGPTIREAAAYLKEHYLPQGWF